MRILVALLAVCLDIWSWKIASAGALSISPTRLAVTPESKVIAFNLRNGSDDKALIEVAIFAWTDVDNPKALTPTDDFLIVPPIAEIPANETQVLRLAPRLAGGLEGERAYRLIVRELPAEVGPQNGVGFAVEMSLPVFLAPEGARAESTWSVRWRDPATPELMVTNHGTAHMRVQSFELFDDAARAPLFASSDGAYVLPGEEKAWPLDIALAQLEGVITVKAETTAGPLVALVALPDSATP
ncbi:MAG: molecular chaperone [Rhizobiales bacterium]|nr:molecular chaperone [Hyphomicrobiales bacterium]